MSQSGIFCEIHEGARVRAVSFLGAFCFSISMAVSPLAKAETSTSPWDKTNFSYALLAKQILRDDVCTFKVRTYLGCVDAVNLILRAASPGYKLASIYHNEDPSFTKHLVVGEFVILKMKDKAALPSYASAVEELNSLRALEKESDEVWSAHMLKGLPGILKIAASKVGPTNEPEIAGSAMNAFLENFIDPHTYFLPMEEVREAAPSDVEYSSGSGASVTPASEKQIEARWLDKVGYIRVRDFIPQDTAARFVKELKSFKDAKGLVVDLRGNPGGRLDNVITMLSYFFNEGDLLISMHSPYSDYVQEEITAAKVPFKYKKSVVVLIDQFSASASELFAGALQDSQKALLMGARSFGKGTRQKVEPSDNVRNTLYAQTSSRFHFASGRSNQKVGLTPEFEVFSHIAPEGLDLLSYREADVYRYPVDAGPEVILPPYPKLDAIRACVERKKSVAVRGYKREGDYVVQMAKLVIECQGSPLRF